MLEGYPDKCFAEYILRGIQNGFRIGFDMQLSSLKTRGSNMQSALEMPEVVTKYLQEEVARGRVVELTPEDAEALQVHTSPFGVIPKKHKPDKWRLILDLSSPEGHSVNDGIAKELASLCYVSVDDVVAQVVRLGRGSMLAKMDIKHAYRNISVHPADCLLLGMLWDNKVYVDTALPFGLRSAPLIFSAVADVLEWVMRQEGVSWLAHNVDDFVTVVAPRTQECQQNVDLMHEVCAKADMPVEPEKDEGPATTIVFLGLELDSTAQEIRLPGDNLRLLRTQLAGWRGRKACKKRELLSLIGSLTHACRAVRPGRAYLRRLINFSASVRRRDQFLRLNGEARADLEWWFRFIFSWNGTAMMFADSRVPPEVTITTDASGNWGCGAFSSTQWFMLPWVMGPIKDLHIMVKELAPIVVAAMVWGINWQGRTILARCDNAAVVGIVNSGSSKNLKAMHFMRCLTFLAAKMHFRVRATHIRGVDNILADALSRDNLSLFRTLFPQADSHPFSVPEEALDMVLLQEPNWIARDWTEQWTSMWTML